MVTNWPFYRKSFADLLAELQAKITAEQKTFLVTANPAILMTAHKDKHYHETIRQADLITPDGIGVVKACQWLGVPVAARLAGFDIMTALMHLANEANWKIYLLGAAPETIGLTAAAINKTRPNVTITGYHHGYFATDENIIAEIQAAEPDLIFVAMGCPKQERWIAKHLHMFLKGLFIGVGGSFDVLAGINKRAPKVWISLNLEWLYRIIQKPKRAMLLKDLLSFAIIVTKEIISQQLKKQTTAKNRKRPS
jgi:N-acetylglucosaminyldiphosphoundecaprenol N-acetyl-beta-D-mannosaminyltransferase